MRPMLIVKTPRAGEFNHRYLVADLSDLDANDVLDWARRTTSRICGPDFFAVYHDVAQLRGGRTGEEGLMLIGIDTAVLGEYQRALLEQLQALLPDLETLVTEEIDWQDYSHEGMVIACPKLNDWMNDLEQTFKQRVGTGSGFPVYVSRQINVDQKQNTQVENRVPINKLNRVLFLIAAIAVISLGLFFYLPMADDKQTGGVQSQGQSGQAQEKLAEDQAELNRSKEKLAEDQVKLEQAQKKLATDQDKMTKAQKELTESQKKLSQDKTEFSKAQAVKLNESGSEIDQIKKIINNRVCENKPPEGKVVNSMTNLKEEICPLLDK